MIASSYPNITEEETSMEFITKGLSSNPMFVDIHRSYLTHGFPSSLDELYSRLTLIEAENKDRNEKVVNMTDRHAEQDQKPRFPKRNNRGGNRSNNAWRGGRNNNQIPPWMMQSFMQYMATNMNPQNNSNNRKQLRKPAHAKASQSQPHPTTAPNHSSSLQTNGNEDLHHLQAHTESDTSKYILDSAANPTQVIKHTKTMNKLTSPLLTLTSTSANHDATHSGTLQIQTDLGHKVSLPAIANPSLTHNLVSVHDTAKLFGQVIFTPRHAYIIKTSRNESPVLVGTAKYKSGLYSFLPRSNITSNSSRTIPIQPHAKAKLPQRSPTKSAAVKIPNTSLTLPHSKRTPQVHNLDVPLPKKPLDYKSQAFYEWHLKFNHINLTSLQQMAKQDLLALPPILKQTPPRLTCSDCQRGKLRPKPHHPTTHHYQVAQSISSDVCGPITPASNQGTRYFITFVDTHSRYLTVFFIANRKNVDESISRMTEIVKRQHGRPPEFLRTDNAKEYTSSNSSKIHAKHGIKSSTTIPYTPQQNSIAERINSTLVSSARSTISHSNLTEDYWEQAIRDAVFKYNISLHSTTKQLPYTLWHGHPPSISKLFAFGQLGAIPSLKDKKSKLERRGIHVRYMYALNAETIMTQCIRTGRLIPSRTINFHPYNKSLDPKLQSSYMFKSVSRHPTPATISSTTPAPNSTTQARKYPDKNDWARAHDLELQKLDQQRTIEWINNEKLPPNIKAIPLTMKYRYKRNSSGAIQEYKARCTLRGDLMQPHVHYNESETSSYMADKTTIRSIIAFAAATGYPLQHFDITSAYLHENSSASTTVYVKQLPKFDGSYSHPSTFGILKKNLYGGKSAGYIYCQGLKSFLLQHGYCQSPHDPLLFFKLTTNSFTLLGISGDDFLVTGSNISLISNLFNTLKTKYNIRNLGFPKKYLGWTITRTADNALHVSQPDYITSVLTSMRMLECNPRKTPYEHKAKLHAPTDADVQLQDIHEFYQKIIGDLRYITDCTRPDIAFAVNSLSAATHKPTTRHWSCLKFLIRYLKGTIHYGILFKPAAANQLWTPTNVSSYKSDLSPLSSYSDSDFANDENDRKSISGGVHLLYGSPIAWQSSKQRIQALSTCEAEYIAATSTTQLTQWLRRLLYNCHLIGNSPIPLYMDNTSAIQVATSRGPTKRHKFIDLRHHYLQSHITNKTIHIKHIPSKQMLADILTKPLSNTLFLSHLSNLNITINPTLAQASS